MIFSWIVLMLWSLDPIVCDNTSSIELLYPLKNYTKVVGDSLKLRCAVKSSIKVNKFVWKFNYAHLEDVKGRIKIKSIFHTHDNSNNNNEKVEDRMKYIQWSTIRIKNLESSDTGFYFCEASNDIDTLRVESVIRVSPGNVNWNNWKKSSSSSFDSSDQDENDYEETEGIIPESFPLDFNADNIEFQGRTPDDFSTHEIQSSGLYSENLPSLKPNERSGSCQIYTGSVCRNSFGSSKQVFVSGGLRQDYIERQLQRSLTVIANSPKLSSKCAQFAIPAICLSTLPLCDIITQKPRKICRDECEVLEYDVCHEELAILQGQPLLNHQLILPNCRELPIIGSNANYNCVSLGMDHTHHQLILPHSCFKNSGSEYRGTVSMSSQGRTCKPWHLAEESLTDVSLLGGHNYCRNPGGIEEEPWCYTNENRHSKVPCGIPPCSTSNIMMIAGLPALSATLLALSACLFCYFRHRRRQSDKNKGHMSPESLLTIPSTQNCLDFEMNSLIPAMSKGAPVREFLINSLRFSNELGDGAFGKMYKGDLIGDSSTCIAIKTLRPGANTKTKQDFQNEIAVYSHLKHPNIICLIGVVLQDEPQCMLFEYSSNRDLHEYLLSLGSKNKSLSYSSSSSPPIFQTTLPHPPSSPLNSDDMSFIIIQIAAGLEYLSSHHYVHRDVATRNCLLSSNLTLKLSDFGLVKDIYAADYYRVPSSTSCLLPIRWMPPESILYGKFSTECDVWAFGVLLWEIYSFGAQPYFGYSNSEVIEMIGSRTLLPCPEECPSRMYGLMVECWHEIPGRRPLFSEIHSRLCHWEAMSGSGYQSATQSVVSLHSGSSTGPQSNNTGSTNLSTNHLYQRPFAHLMTNCPSLQTSIGPNGLPHSSLLGPSPSSLQMV